MLNLRPLPDLLALTILVYVFWSILRRRAGEQLSAWLLGWVFILLHFAVQLIGGRPGVLQDFAMAISAILLALAGAAFIYAAGGARSSTRVRWILMVAVFATALYIAIAYLENPLPSYYYIPITILILTGVAILLPHSNSTRVDRIIYAFFVFALAGVLIFLARNGWQGYGLQPIFFFIYLFAGVQCWRTFPRGTTGSITAVVGFMGWAFVFPVSIYMALLKPDVHIAESVWNIPKFIVAIGILLTLLEEQIDRTEHLALHDPLTGLPNRRLLDDRLMKAIERAERNEARVAVLLIDLDSFKQINDTYGHAVGDEVLRIVSARLQMRVRKADTIARAGGDEFLVVVSDLLQAQGATVLATKILADLNEPIAMGEVMLKTGASIGVAIYPDDAQTSEALCAKADAAMYAQKRGNR